jgi:hypothetical protein
MISKALRLIVDQVRQYIASTDAVAGAIDAPDYVVLGNIALADVPDLTPTIKQRTVLSLVNTSEEATLKNKLHYERTGTETRYQNPPIHLNLFLLFSANYDDYENALLRLSQVIEFFQGKNVFTYLDSPMDEFQDDADVAEIKLILDLHTMTFEQINYLWGSLGGKQVPFVMYKVRLVKIQVDRTQATGALIQEIESGETLL